MISIKELEDYSLKYSQRDKRLAEFDSVNGFIRFIEAKQKEKGRSVISMDQRESTRRLKELRERQKLNKPITPEEDFKIIQ